MARTHAYSDVEAFLPGGVWIDALIEFDEHQGVASLGVVAFGIRLFDGWRRSRETPRLVRCQGAAGRRLCSGGYSH